MMPKKTSFFILSKSFLLVRTVLFKKTATGWLENNVIMIKSRDLHLFGGQRYCGLDLSSYGAELLALTILGDFRGLQFFISQTG